MSGRVLSKESILFDVDGFYEHGFCNTAPGVEVYYALFGRGPTKIVLLMGIATSGLAWKNQIEFFIRFPQYQICIIDNRGSGKTTAPIGRFTTSMMAQDVVQVINHLRWDKVHVVGNSLGGMIAQELALAIPHKLLTLTLIATHAGGWRAYIPPWQALYSVVRHPFGKNEKEQMRLLMEMVFSPKFLSLPGKKENFSIINAEYSTVFDFYIDGLEQVDEIFVKENRVFMFGQQLSAVLTHNVSSSRLSTLRNKFPIMLITGTGDKIVHPSHTDYLHSVLGGHLVKFEGAGHAVTEECLDQVNAALHNHFSKVTWL